LNIDHEAAWVSRAEIKACAGTRREVESVAAAREQERRREVTRLLRRVTVAILGPRINAVTRQVRSEEALSRPIEMLARRERELELQRPRPAARAGRDPHRDNAGSTRGHAQLYGVVRVARQRDRPTGVLACEVRPQVQAL